LVIDLEAGADGSVRSRTYSVDPSALGLATAHAAALRGGDAPANAAAVRRVLSGEVGPERDVVVLNAAAGIVVAGLREDLAGGVAAAEESIDSGSAAAVLEGLVATSQALARET
jgi:anthranilate phosphoribosyltransferase